MKIYEAEKIAAVIATAEDQHNSPTATIKIKRDLCRRMSEAFADFYFELDEISGAVVADKRKTSRGASRENDRSIDGD